MRNSAILMPGFTGDFVLALSVVLRKAQECDEQLTLIVPQHLIPLCTLITSLPYFPYRRSSRSELIETIEGVKRQGFDRLYLLTTSFSAAWFGMRTGIADRRALRGDRFTSFLHRPLTEPPQSAEGHVTREFSYILEVDHQEPSDWEGVPIKAISEYSNDIVVLCPGIGHDVSGRWQGFRDLVKLLPSYEFVVLGNDDDGDAANAIASHLPHRVHNRVGTTSIEAAAAIVSSASVVISNHCGLMHLAGFLGVPVVGIFGSSSPVRYRPLGQAVRCAEPKKKCQNCRSRSCTHERHECLDSIETDQVLALANEIVQQVV